jgi:hypothetical protein
LTVNIFKVWSINAVSTPKSAPEPSTTPTVYSFQNSKSTGTSPTFENWIRLSSPHQEEERVHIWHAIKFATDDDFLEKSDIRAVFRKNALSEEETMLFSLPDIAIDDAGNCRIM